MVELVGVPTSLNHRGLLVAEEGVEEDRDPAVFEDAEREVGVFVVAPAPPIRDRVVDQDAGVDTCVETKRGVTFVP